ncbi:class I SAM-dependent methyltransferase [Pseudomonas sp. GD03858]|uniref:class I SAM-dependent methyltransferase n=1 Tax=unclassified Pseudomonas TaxID=196821 RepID=UPI00244B0FF9|nr:MULTISPECIES: class I SAM-dependent methyltransferase [unclassified Pseudomonas]MDH0647769.1 class I SAM-dependent methyltransferase [Pseudomonas sp. GD03867]MDH0663955.1 class I SAM-dependent methyltransferase [Pseudomonas sp. GD03858]
MSTFSDPQAVARYAEGPVRQVPGFLDLQRMATLLLAEKVPDDGQVLVLGAGGGLELKAFALAHPGWRFLGVDPSAEMLALARQTLAELAPRAVLHEGYIDSAPERRHDGATCLLTLHFLDAEQRLHTLEQLARRLKPGAPLVVAHHSFPQAEPDKTRWLQRYAAFAESSGIPREQARSAINAIASRLPLITAEQDEAILRQAGFEGIALFYAGFTFKGWVAYLPG